VREVHLLGQNVTAWGKDFEKRIPFSELLYEVSKVEGVERIRFTTGHPRDLTDDTIEAMRDIPQVCNALHLPFQAGSNRILELMDRKYTKEFYLDRIDRLKEAVKDIALSTDIIVGFPTETDEDFEHTLDVVTLSTPLMLSEGLSLSRYSPSSTLQDRTRRQRIWMDRFPTRSRKTA